MRWIKYSSKDEDDTWTSLFDLTADLFQTISDGTLLLKLNTTDDQIKDIHKQLDKAGISVFGFVKDWALKWLSCSDKLFT